MKYNDNGTYEDIVIKAVAPGRNSYSSSQQEVYSCNYVNGAIDAVDTKVNNITGTILWTNPGTSITADSTITLSSDDYDILEIFYTASSSNYMTSQKIIKGFNVNLSLGNYGEKGRGIYWRELTRTDDTHYTVGNGNYFTSNGNGNDAVNVIIPRYIVGYKTGLTFN